MRTAARIFNIIGFKHAAKLAHGCGIAVKQFCLSPKMQRCIAGKGFFYENIMRAAHNYRIYCFTFKERKMLFEYVIKRIGGRYPAVFITRKVFFYGLLTILPVFLFQPFSVTPEVLARPAVWGNLLFLGIVASMLCYVLWNAAMHRLGAVRTTNYIYFNPLVTIITAAACIGERITPAALAGAALILYGMWRAERG